MSQQYVCINPVNIQKPIHHFARYFVLMGGGMVSEMLKMWYACLADSMGELQ